MTPIDRAGQPAELAPGFVFLADNSGVLPRTIVAFQTITPLPLTHMFSLRCMEYSKPAWHLLV